MLGPRSQALPQRGDLREDISTLALMQSLGLASLEMCMAMWTGQLHEGGVQRLKGVQGSETCRWGACQEVTEVRPMKNPSVIINVTHMAAFGAGTVPG